MDAIELERVQAELERLHDRCERGLLLASEISPILTQLDELARAALPQGSDLFRLYDSRMRAGTEYWEKTMNGYVARRDCRNIGRRISVLREVLAEIEPDFLRAEARAPTQLYFQAGEGYLARREFFRLLRRATKTIDIADPFLDPDVFNFVDALDPVVAIRLLTGVTKPLFVQQLHGLQAMQLKVEARSNDRNHDRFVILDGSEVWHLGASINGLGQKACMLNKVIAGSERERVLVDFNDWWSSGTVV